MKKRLITALTMLFTVSLALVLSGCDNFSLIELLNNDITLIPSEVTLNLNESINFEVSAGVAPFTFTEVGDGTFPNGVFTAPGTAGNYTIQVKDGRNRTSKAVITVVDPATQVSLTPAKINTTIGGTVAYTISGGTPDVSSGYTITVLNSLGSIVYHPLLDQNTFDYIAGTVAGNDVIQVSDTLGQTAEAYVTITNSSDLMISPSVGEVLTGGNVFPFSASGGNNTSYTFSIVPPKTLSGTSSINSANGRYTSPTDTGIETVRVTDFSNETADATVYIVTELLKIIPSGPITLHVGDPFTFSASNGNPPYSYSILGNEPSGSIDSSSGVFTALVKDNRVTVVVEDQNGNTDTCRVKIKN